MNKLKLQDKKPIKSFILNDLPHRDIFDQDGDVVYNKLFFALYDEIPHYCNIAFDLDVQKCLNALLVKYQISSDSVQIRKHETFSRENREEFMQLYRPGLRTYHAIFLKDKLLVLIDEDGLTLIYSHSIVNDEIEEIKTLAREYQVIKGEQKSKFYMVTSRAGDWDLSEFEIKHTDIQLENCYNDDFIYYHDMIVTSLSDKHQTGIIILHGMHGTGKTSYIRHLINTTALKFIYLPSYMADSLVDPAFLPFLTEHTNSVLILEDCEQVLLDREAGNRSTAIANILNLGDGLLGDALGIKVICTFNTALSKIDKALTRKGRMIARYEFGELKREKAEKLAAINSLKLNHNKPLTLANIFGGLSQIETKTEKRQVGYK